MNTESRTLSFNFHVMISFFGRNKKGFAVTVRLKKETNNNKRLKMIEGKEVALLFIDQ